MASNILRKSLNPFITTTTTSQLRHLSTTSAAAFSSNQENDEPILVKGPKKTSDVVMPTSSMTGSIVGRRFYKKVSTREAEDGVGWSVMLDYRTLKTPSKRPLKCPTLGLAKAIAAEWEYQQTDGIRPFTMPLMKLACTALERVPITRPKVIENLMKKFHQDLVFCRAPDGKLTRGVLDRQVQKIDPLLDWVESEFGFKPMLYTSFFGGRQGEELAAAFENVLKKADDCELAAIDAIASAAHSLVIAIGMVRGRLGIEEAIELIRLEEDLQVDKWGLVEGDRPHWCSFRFCKSLTYCLSCLLQRI
ncbi:hypothetical protein Leryth_021403 [Lithospermum erythrorhizon]|nr:hypothetical protein Leryth_021403 [Lithospermum erythrorhizon]